MALKNDVYGVGILIMKIFLKNKSISYTDDQLKNNNPNITQKGPADDKISLQLKEIKDILFIDNPIYKI